jgi:hypothetical protein
MEKLSRKTFILQFLLQGFSAFKAKNSKMILSVIILPIIKCNRNYSLLLNHFSKLFLIQNRHA